MNPYALFIHIVQLKKSAFKEMWDIALSLMASGNCQYWSSCFRTPRPLAGYASKHALTPSSVKSSHLHSFTDWTAHWHPPFLHLRSFMLQSWYFPSCRTLFLCSWTISISSRGSCSWYRDTSWTISKSVWHITLLLLEKIIIKRILHPPWRGCGPKYDLIA